jgi:uncharacterized protein with HEPN domain
MRATLSDRLEHIREAIGDIRALLAGKTIEIFDTERATRAAFERFVEIISEASRHIPAESKARFPLIPWTDIANIGNRLRHAYDGVDPEILWNVYLHELDALETAVKEMASEADNEKS